MMLILTVASPLTLLFLLLRFCTANDHFHFFHSRPDLTPPVLQVDILKEGASPGYIFVAPHHISFSGAAIYDNHGQLVWTSLASIGGGNIHSFRVCRYKGADCLCFYHGEPWATFYAGDVHIYSHELVPLATVKTQNGRPAIDMHENNLVEDGRAMIVDIYRVVRYDLSEYGITAGEGWVRDGLFQKIDVDTGELLFEWSALDHIPPSESYVPLGNSIGAAGGAGLDAVSGWDYLHLNAIDENADGDYLVSCRHTQAVYKVSGEDGRILWRFGGKTSDFEMLDGLTFGWQHHVRWRFSNATTDILTLFDNAFDGVHMSSPRSSGKIIKLEHDTTPPRASLIASFVGPEGMGSSATQGSMQILGDHPDATASQSNVFIGWGSQPYVSEHAPSGEIVFQAKVNVRGANVYRAYKFNFTSNPTDSPALYTYAWGVNAQITMFYMSWNGATEIAQWRVHGRQACDAEWTDLGTVDKQGFETSYQAPGYWTFGMVEALDRDGRSLRTSATNGLRTFVPSPALSSSCNATGCPVTLVKGAAATSPQPLAESQSGCPFVPKQVAKGMLERLGLDPRRGHSQVIWWGLLVCLVLGLVAYYQYPALFRSRSHTLLPQVDPEA